MKRRVPYQGLLSDIMGANEGEKLQESPSGQERKEVDPQKSELAKSLREFSRRYPRHDWVEPVKGLPLVPAPPSLGGTPFILGGDAARYVEQLRALNPRILEQIGQITTGPNLAFIEQVIRANRSDVLGDRRNPLPRLGAPTGIFHKRRRSIYLNPYARGQELFRTLAHELSHGAGTNEEAAYRIGDEAVRFFSGDYGAPPKEQTKKQKPGILERMLGKFRGK